MTTSFTRVGNQKREITCSCVASAVRTTYLGLLTQALRTRKLRAILPALWILPINQQSRVSSLARHRLWSRRQQATLSLRMRWRSCHLILIASLYRKRLRLAVSSVMDVKWRLRVVMRQGHSSASDVGRCIIMSVIHLLWTWSLWRGSRTGSATTARLAKIVITMYAHFS